MEKIFPPENIKGLEANKVNIEVWRKISHIAKHSVIRFQSLQNLTFAIKALFGFC